MYCPSDATLAFATRQWIASDGAGRGYGRAQWRGERDGEGGSDSDSDGDGDGEGEGECREAEADCLRKWPKHQSCAGMALEPFDGE
jgi:hypothetical protein